jgi:hypothetical protein
VQWGNTPLHWAAKKGYASVVTLLLERGANKNAKENVRTCHHAHTHALTTQHMAVRA